MPVPSNDLFNRCQFPSNPTTRAIAATSAVSAQLGIGLYVISSDINCFFKQGASNVVATTSSNPLWANQYMTVYVDDTTNNAYIAVICASGLSGTLYISKLEQM